MRPPRAEIEFHQFNGGIINGPLGRIDIAACGTTPAFSRRNLFNPRPPILILSLSPFFAGTPINRLPIMAKQVLDLYELYNLVTARGGLVEVINKKQWQEIIKGLNLPSSITSAAFTLRTQ